jgi:hypothetical protein
MVGWGCAWSISFIAGEPSKRLFNSRDIKERVMTRYRTFAGIAVAVAASVVAGCAQLQSGVNAFNTIRLYVGMTREEVIATMGKPQIREAYGKTEFLIYRTDLPVPAGNADFTPVALMNGKVTSWGRKPYDEARRKRAEANTKKPQQ